MANYTPNLNLEKPLQTENYDVDVFNDNFDKIDNFARQTPARALTADKLTVGAKINNVLFNGTTDIEIPIGIAIGSIIYVICSSSYVPDNCLPCDGAEYAKSQFNDLWTNYLASGKLATCSYSDYTAEISANGFCAKFAIDTTTEKFKVPTLNNTVYQGHSSTAGVLGNGKNLGFYDGTNEFTLQSSGNAYPGKFAENVGSSVGSSYTVAALAGNDKSMGVIADTTKSGLIADMSAIKDVSIRYFVVVANGSINQAQMDWSQWASSLAGKANTSLDNVANTSGFRKLVEAKVNGLSGYKIFREYDAMTSTYLGLWCEEWGETGTTSGQRSISFTNTFKDTNYIASFCFGTMTTFNTTSVVMQNMSLVNATVSGFSIATGVTIPIRWKVEGYLAESEE